MRPFTQDEILECHPLTLSDLELLIEQAGLADDCETRLRDAVRSLLQFTFDQGVVDAFNKAACS